MGLYASFTPEELGYPMTLEQDVLNEMVMVEVDYSGACEAFCDTFLDVAESTVPVDTGYLQSSISADTDGEFCEAEASAEYAQYVEYGTWKMAAQPYFTPAIEAGLAAFQAAAQEALNEAQEELEDLAQAIIDAAQEEMMAEMGEEGGLLQDLGSLLTAGLMMIVLFPIMVNLYGIMDTLSGGSNNNSFNISGGGGGIEIIIT